MGSWRAPFPSMSDLLAAPLIKPFVDKLHSGAVIAAAKGVFDDVRTEMKSVATEFRMPDVSELVGRIAERLTDHTQRLPRPRLNATGIFFHPDAQSLPLPPQALEQMIAVGGLSLDTSPLQTMLCELTGAEDATLISTFVAAKHLAITSSPSSPSPPVRLIVARRDMYEQTLGDRLIDLCPSDSLMEVGAANRTTPNDYIAAIDRCAAGSATVYFASGDFSACRFTLEPEAMTKVIERARERSLRVIVELEFSTLTSLAAYGLPSVPVIRDVVSLGADLVVFRSGQLVGGPDCGVLVGRSRAIAAVRQHRLSPALRCDPMLQTGIQATLALYYEKGNRVDQAIPTLELLSTSMGNLKNRAERLAGQLKSVAMIESVTVVEETASLTLSGTLSLPTYQLEIVPRHQTVAAWAELLRCGNPSLWLRIAQRGTHDIACIDLRTVSAAHDRDIVEVISHEVAQ